MYKETCTKFIQQKNILVKNITSISYYYFAHTLFSNTKSTLSYRSNFVKFQRVQICKYEIYSTFAQYWHRYGVSPVWHRVWLSKCSFLAKDFPHIVQLYGLSVEWRFMWRSKDAAFANTWKQTAHVNMLPPKWHFPCLPNSWAFVNALPQTYDKKQFIDTVTNLE